MKTFKTEIEWTLLPIKPKIGDWIIIAKGDRERIKVMVLCESKLGGVTTYFYVSQAWYNELDDYFYFIDDCGDEDMIFDAVAWVYYKDFVHVVEVAFTSSLDHTVIT